MADSSLDDFFAKKDKSKKKSKSKMNSTDSKGDEGQKKKKDKEMPGGLGLITPEEAAAKKQAEEEDWVDYEEKKEVDYSGLRIQTLQISKEEEEKDGDSDGDGSGEEGEEGREKESGPWNSSSQPTAPVKAKEAVPARPPSPEPEKEKPAEPSGPKKYVPPAQRAGAMQPVNPIARRVNKKIAPNIKSEEDFPTLGGGPSPASGSAWGAKKYEDSGAGDIESNPSFRKGGNLSLENKFAALQD